jgi:hypothetical protein
MEYMVSITDVAGNERFGPRPRTLIILIEDLRGLPRPSEQIQATTTTFHAIFNSFSLTQNHATPYRLSN